VALYVYGIVEAGSRPPAQRGIADAPLRLIEGEGSSALVSEIDGHQVRLGREAVLRHAHVLERALERGPVLPMRFGVVMSGPEEIQSRLLEDHAEELRAQLTDFAGKVEIRIRAVYDEDALMHEVVRENPEIASLRSAVRAGSDDATYYERIRLGELVAGAVERRRERDAEVILDALATQALAVEVGEPTHERIVVQASFLVERDRLAKFDQIVDDIAGGYGGGIRFKYTGPLPPHSFVELAERV
jgi:Gas vesicle synthesis protein GvpL/GvpF